MTPGISPQQEARAKFVGAFNDTMVKIWKEKIVKLGVIDTGALYRSVVKVRMLNRDGKFLDVELAQSFNTYGIYVNFGTGRDTPRGNGGDLGHDKKRRARRWFDKKYFASVMKLQEFYADNLGRQGAYIIANQLTNQGLRDSVTLPS